MVLGTGLPPEGHGLRQEWGVTRTCRRSQKARGDERQAALGAAREAAGAALGREVAGAGGGAEQSGVLAEELGLVAPSAAPQPRRTRSQ
jgi:hypothetical protein